MTAKTGDLLAQLLKLGFPGKVLEGGLELARHGANLRHILASRAHHPRQVLRAYEDDGNDHKGQQF